MVRNYNFEFNVKYSAVAKGRNTVTTIKVGRLLGGRNIFQGPNTPIYPGGSKLGANYLTTSNPTVKLDADMGLT